MDNENIELENYLFFMKYNIDLFKRGGLASVNKYLDDTRMGKLPPECENAFYEELEKAWTIELFWNENYYNLMKDDHSYRINFVNLLKLMSKYYNPNDKYSIEFYIIGVTNCYPIHDFIVDRLFEKCKQYVKVCKYLDSILYEEFEDNGEKVQIFDSFISYNFMDTDLSFEDWIDSNQFIHEDYIIKPIFIEEWLKMYNGSDKMRHYFNEHHNYIIS